VPSPWSLLNWGLKTIGLMGESSRDVDGRLRVEELVIAKNVEKIAAEVLARQAKRGTGPSDRVISREAFAKDLASGIGNHGESSLPEKDAEVLLKFLERDKMAVSYDEKIVKFKPASAGRPDAITHQDITVASLKTLISTLTSQCDTLSKRISSLTATASTEIKSSNRILALSALRSKKLAEKNLKQRADTLSQLEEIYTKIEHAADQVEIVRVMEASTGVLRGLNKEVVGVERVEDVIEELREEMGKVDEVGHIINEPIGAREQVDESEVDDELEAMEREERVKEAKRASEREEEEAKRTRRRLEEVAQREDLGEAAKKSKLEQLERQAGGSEATRPRPDGAEQQLDASTNRLSQLSVEVDGGGKRPDANGMEGVRKTVAEAS
jgi:charged multivesicular body protein 7